MSLVSLKTELRQELKLTPQLLQSMEVLQMNVQDLAEYLSRASEENPLLEAESPASLQNACPAAPGRQLAGRRSPGRHLSPRGRDRTGAGRRRPGNGEPRRLPAGSAGAAALGKTPIGVVYIPGRAGG